MKHKAYLKPGSKNEIIISAGAIGSPQLLMLNGIGPEAHLRKLGIRVLVDQPMVGQGMADNPMNAVMIPSPVPVEFSLSQAVGITEFDSYIEAISGTNFVNAIIHSIPTDAQVYFLINCKTYIFSTAIGLSFQLIWPFDITSEPF